MSKTLSKLALLVIAGLSLTLLTAPVVAQSGGKLWFYSVDPSTIAGPQPLPNPEPDGESAGDPNYYYGNESDPWLVDSVVTVQNLTEPFSIWIGFHDPVGLGINTCYDTTLVISINDAAAAVITGINLTPGGAVGALDTNPANFPLPPHGIPTDPDYAGFYTVNVGDIPAQTALEIQINITLGSELTGEELIHLDAYGWLSDTHTGDPEITNPFSHDYSFFLVPEGATILLATSGLLAFGFYTYLRKKR